MSPLSRLEQLYTSIPRYDLSCAPSDVQRSLAATQARASSPHLSALRGLVALPQDHEAEHADTLYLAVLEYEKHSLLDALKYNRHALHATSDAPVRLRGCVSVLRTRTDSLDRLTHTLG